MTWPFGSLRPHAYRVIYADPPWRFETWSAKGGGKSPDMHYPTMQLPELMALPVWRLAAADCALIMWVYDPRIPDALALMQAWGFEMKTRVFDWGKGTFGKGKWSRHGGEQCWLGTRGAPERRARNVRQYYHEKPREHSRKPAHFAREIERMLDGPYCELFSRTERPGWSSWGLEVGKFQE